MPRDFLDGLSDGFTAGPLGGEYDIFCRAGPGGACPDDPRDDFRGQSGSRDCSWG